MADSTAADPSPEPSAGPDARSAGAAPAASSAADADLDADLGSCTSGGTRERFERMLRDELGRIARERGSATASFSDGQPPALVRQVWQRLGADGRVTERDREGFLGGASRALRSLLVDSARRRRMAGATASTGDSELTDQLLSELVELLERRAGDLLDLDRALQGLELMHPRQARVLELRFFGGLAIESVAAVLGVDRATVERDWLVARLWLRGARG